MIRISRRAAAWPLEIPLALVAYALIHINAVDVIAPSYGQFMPRTVAPWEHLLAILCMLAPFSFLRRGVATPAACASWTLYGFVYLSAAVIGVTVLPDIIDYLALMGFLAACLFVFHLVAAGIPMPKLAKAPIAVPLDFVLFVFLAVLCLYTWYKAGFYIRIGIDDVYGRRLDVRESGGFAGYAMAPFRLLLPTLAIQAWRTNRNIIWVLLLGLSCLGIYSYDGTKTTFVFPVVLFILANGIAKGRIACTILALIVGLNLLAYLEYASAGHFILADYIIRRSFVVPGLLTSFYWEYGPCVNNLRQVTYEIGSVYLGNSDANANSNFWMWGWAWLGIAGGLLVSMVGGMLISLFASYPGSRFPKLGSLMACGCALIWTEQFLHTSLLTSGVIYLTGLAFMMRLAPNSFKSLAPQALAFHPTQRVS